MAEVTEAFARCQARLASSYGRREAELLASAALSAPASELALHRLEEWAGKVSNPGAVLAELRERPSVARLFANVMAASRGVSAAIIQSPDIGIALLDPDEWAVPPDPVQIEQEVRTLLAQATGPQHGHDRLRYCKQLHTAKIVMAELAGAWEPEAVWKALSDLADVLVPATFGWMAPELAERVGIVAWGKLGGQELNVSSDVDLVLVAEDGAEDPVLVRTAERFARQLAEPMGRGILYRADFRLRPFGKAGPLVPSMSAVEAYYERYAEPWEVLALVRSRSLTGGRIGAWWGGLRESAVFRPARSAQFVESLLEVRERIEQACPPDDFKGGPGGIRDAEFFVQILQVLHGHRVPEARVRGTLPALRALRESGIVSEREATVIGHGYTMMRELEHRCQVWDDSPARRLPTEPATLAWLAKGLGYGRPEALLSHLAAERADVRYVYRRRFGESLRPGFDGLAERTGKPWPVVVRLLGEPDSEQPLWQAVASNESSLERVAKLASECPAFVPEFLREPALIEDIVSGEIVEEQAPLGDTDPVPWARRAWLRAVARQALAPGLTFPTEAAATAGSALAALASQFASGITVASLGSFSTQELGPRSDLDVLLLAEDGDERAEGVAEAFVGRLQELRSEGFPLALDLRLRPDGRRGRLVVTPTALAGYAERAMEDWERLAWGRARLVAGDPAAVARLLGTARSGPLDRCRLDSLLAMRRRIADERLPAAHRIRHCKLSEGALIDIDWLAEFVSWRAGRTPGPTDPATAEFRLAATDLVGPDERRALLEAHEHYLRLRFRLAALGFPDDVMPENPDKLEVLARLQCARDGNEVLAEFERHRARVSKVFQDVVARF